MRFSSLLARFGVLPMLLTLISCSVNGFTDDYDKLSPEQKSRIVPLKTFEAAGLDTVYRIDGAALQQEIKKQDKALVYLFTNGCVSKSCLPLLVYENYAAQHGYKLYLVMDGFKKLDQTTNQPLTTPLFAVDAAHYQSRVRSTYTRRFENELLGRDLDHKADYAGNLFVFEQGVLVHTWKDLPATTTSNTLVLP